MGLAFSDDQHQRHHHELPQPGPPGGVEVDAPLLVRHLRASGLGGHRDPDGGPQDIQGPR